MVAGRSRETRYRFTSIVRCTAGKCKLPFYMTITGTFVEGMGHSRTMKTVTVWPVLNKKMSEHILEDVQEDFRQAFAAFHMHLDRAATLMLRRCIENACRAKGAKKEMLYAMIDELKDSGLLHPMNAVSAHKARILGKYTAHLYREVTHGELETALVLTERILEDLFVVPVLQDQIAAKP